MASGNRYAQIDLAGDDTYTDYGLRLIRHNGGANTFSQLTHQGTGELQIHCQHSGFIGFHTSNQGRMRVTSSGHILFGQTSSSVPGLGNTTVGGSFEKTSSGGAFFSSRADGPAHFVNRNNDGNCVEFFRSGNSKGSISVNNSNTSFNTSSDYRLKENIVDLTGAITRLKQLQPKRFNFIASPGDSGWIHAHEAATVIPEAVLALIMNRLGASAQMTCYQRAFLRVTLSWTKMAIQFCVSRHGLRQGDPTADRCITGSNRQN